MGIRWGVVIAGALLAEVGIAALVFPVRFFVSEEAFISSVAPACLAMTLVFGFWAGVRARVKPVIHGTLVGVVAALLYIVLTIGQTLPPEFVISHFVKVAGGLAGGGLAAWRLGRVPAAPSRCSKGGRFALGSMAERRGALFAHVLEEGLHAIGGVLRGRQRAEHLHHRALLVADDEQPSALGVRDAALRPWAIGWRKRRNGFTHSACTELQEPCLHARARFRGSLRTARSHPATAIQHSIAILSERSGRARASGRFQLVVSRSSLVVRARSVLTTNDPRRTTNDEGLLVLRRRHV